MSAIWSQKDMFGGANPDVYGGLYPLKPEWEVRFQLAWDLIRVILARHVRCFFRLERECCVIFVVEDC